MVDRVVVGHLMRLPFVATTTPCRPHSKGIAHSTVVRYRGQQFVYVYFEDEPSASLSNKTGRCEPAAGRSESP